MKREEEIEKMSNEYADEYKNEWWGGHSNVDDFIDLKLAVEYGVDWADKHPRNDMIGVVSISHIRNILIGKFCNITKKNPDKTYDEIPEMKEAFEMVDMFDKACEFAGYKFK